MIDKNKQYFVFNYNNHPVAVSTRYESYIIAAMQDGTPGTWLMTWDEILYVNNTTQIFKRGHLRFDPADEEEAYAELRIPNWRDIMTNEQVEEIVMSGDLDGLQRILDINDEAYFDRVRGVFMGLKNGGVKISSTFDDAIARRYIDLRNGKRTNDMSVYDANDTAEEMVQRSELDAMKAEMEALKAALAAAIAPAAPAKKEAASKKKESKPKEPKKEEVTE